MRQDFWWGMNCKLWKGRIQGSLICEWLCWEHMVWSLKGRKISVHYVKCFGFLKTEVGGCQLSGARPFISFTKSTRKRFSWRQRSQLGHSQLNREMLSRLGHNWRDWSETQLMEGAKWKEHVVKLYSTFYDQNYLLQCYSLPKGFSWFGRPIFQKCQVFSVKGCREKHIENSTLFFFLQVKCCSLQVNKYFGFLTW